MSNAVKEFRKTAKLMVDFYNADACKATTEYDCMYYTDMADKWAQVASHTQIKGMIRQFHLNFDINSFNDVYGLDCSDAFLDAYEDLLFEAFTVLDREAR